MSYLLSSSFPVSKSRRPLPHSLCFGPSPVNLFPSKPVLSYFPSVDC